MFLSIVIPAYNEEKRIGDTIQAIHNFMEARGEVYEVIVVDDGSVDMTCDVAEGSILAQNGRLRIIHNGKNRGKGFSVKNGILSSSGEYVLICDADMSTPISELDKLFVNCGDKTPVVIGSRSLDDSSVGIRQPWYREKMGKIFNFFVRLLILNGFRDTQCGFKLIRGDVAREIGKDLKIEGFCFDVEILYIANKRGYGIKEVGVVWDDSSQSKVKILNSSSGMFLDLLKIKKFHG
jgi:dolichyl-phosphate beta-glucosyltransferase